MGWKCFSQEEKFVNFKYENNNKIINNKNCTGRQQGKYNKHIQMDVDCLGDEKACTGQSNIGSFIKAVFQMKIITMNNNSEMI